MRALSDVRLPLDQGAMHDAAQRGLFVTFLHALPRERWAEEEEDGNTLLHYACRGNNSSAVVELLKQGLKVNARSMDERAHLASGNAQPRVLQLLFAAGADMRALDHGRFTPLDWAVDLPHWIDCVRVLLSNGVRLASVHKNRQQHIQPWMVALEAGVLHCRAAVVTLLGIKRREWDRFLVRELAFSLNATRADKGWQI